jgi:hypothetical protein
MATETQSVCDPERVKTCPCADADGDLGEFTCACSEPNITGNCETCGSPMVLVRWDTGEPVEAVAS